MTTLAQGAADSFVVLRRNLIKIRRVPDVLVFATLSPIMFVLLFRYVFGSAITTPGISYAEYLLPGIFTQTIIFGSTFTGASLADDLQKGLIDRFRSLPMARSAVLVGRTTADIGINLVTTFVMSVTGLIVGWRIHSSFLDALAGYLLLLLFAFALSWVMAVIGMLVRTPEVFNNATFIVIFPLTFVANTFVPTNNFPTVLRVFADWNPVSSATQAARQLFGNVSPQLPAPDVWPLQHPTLYTFAWVIVLLAVFVPLAVRTYLRTSTR